MNNDDVPSTYKCEVVEGKIKMFFSSKQNSERKLSSSESMEEIIIALLEYTAGIVAEDNIFVSALAVKGVKGGGDSSGQVQKLTPKTTSLMSEPIFLGGVAVAGGLILLSIGLVAATKRRKKGNNRCYDRLDSVPYGILPRSHPRSDMDSKRYEEVESTSDRESQTEMGQIGGFNVDDIDSFEIKSGFEEQNVEEWLESIDQYQTAYERLNLSGIVETCCVEIESVSSQSGVFDNITDPGNVGEI